MLFRSLVLIFGIPQAVVLWIFRLSYREAGSFRCLAGLAKIHAILLLIAIYISLQLSWIAIFIQPTTPGYVPERLMEVPGYWQSFFYRTAPIALLALTGFRSRLGRIAIGCAVLFVATEILLGFRLAQPDRFHTIVP